MGTDLPTIRKALQIMPLPPADTEFTSIIDRREQADVAPVEQPQATRVRIEHGAAETNEFWDVYLTPAQLEYAGVNTDMTGFSIALDLETGEVALNAGYAPGSPQHTDETSMFAEFGDSAVQALLEHVRSRGGNYGRFEEVASTDERLRLDRIDGLSIHMVEETDDYD